MSPITRLLLPTGRLTLNHTRKIASHVESRSRVGHPLFLSNNPRPNAKPRTNTKIIDTLTWVRTLRGEKVGVVGVVVWLFSIKRVVRRVGIRRSRVGIRGSRVDIRRSGSSCREAVTPVERSCLPSTTVVHRRGRVAAAVALAGTSRCRRAIVGAVRCRRGGDVRMRAKIGSACRGKMAGLLAAVAQPEGCWARRPWALACRGPHWWRGHRRERT